MDNTEALKLARQSRKEATPHKLTRKAAIRAKCTECIYDPVAGGSELAQITARDSTDCALHEWRPQRKAVDATTTQTERTP